MKKLYTLAILLSLGILYVGCTDDDKLSPNSVLDKAVETPSALDTWIAENYNKPYNIDVMYRWRNGEFEQNKYLYPPSLDKVKPILEIILKVWIEPYNEVGGADFVKKVAPRQISLVGGYNVNSSGTITLGFADSGMKITLFNVDQLDLTNKAALRRYFHTIQHEYCHILNQTKPFNPNYGAITPSGYTGTWYNTSIVAAREQGFITDYAKASDFEDFAEVASTMLSMTKAEYDAIVDGISSDTAKANLRAKESIVVDYFRSEWNIDIYELQAVIDAKMNTIINP